MTGRSIPVLDGREVIRALERAGFELDRIRGSHHVMRKPGPPLRIVAVPVHGKRILPLGTLKSIIKQSGLTVEEFTALL